MLRTYASSSGAFWISSRIAGVRADYFGFDVTDRLEDESSLGSRTSGVRDAALVSPKASVVLTPLPETDVYLNFGMGFHSNDARGNTRRRRKVLPARRGPESTTAGNALAALRSCPSSSRANVGM